MSERLWREDLSDSILPMGARSLSIAVRAEIEKLILGHRLPIGERLNESSFAARFGVSRGPIREAFRGLVEAGLLEFVPNQGVFIRRISLAQAIEAYEVRAGLFGLAGRLAASRIREDEIAVLRALVGGMEARIAAGDGAGYYGLNLDLHARILAATRNAQLVATYENLIKKLHLFRAKNWDNPSELRTANTEHAAMVAALAARDEAAAFDAHFGHVMNAKTRAEAAARAEPPQDTPEEAAHARPGSRRGNHHEDADTAPRRPDGDRLRGGRLRRTGPRAGAGEDPVSG